MTIDPINHCSFCAKHKDLVGKLIVGYNSAICNECVDLCVSLLDNEQNTKKKTTNKPTIPDPKDIRDYLDQHVVGQDDAKIVLAVAIANHYKRINKGPDQTQIAKGNILMIGPTGTGKTLMARNVAQYLDVPFVVADATTLTEAGYVGDDVESLISRLYAAADNDVERCQRGIVFLDEVDKISRKSESSTVSKDVSGEGVQQALLKLVEGTRCKITPQGTKRNSENTVEIDTTNILFIAGGAFVGLDNIIKKREQGTSMGFGAQINTSTNSDAEVMPDDLVKFGMIPEFVGRFTSYVNLHDLSKEQLISILTKVKHNFVEQYKWLFDQDGVGLDFDPESLDLIADRTLKTKTGARGLHSELERVLLPHMFDLPRYKRANILQVIINKTQVNTPMTLLKENS
jgi:ATP-dependent Clp protease ATP-binding subunit ClpX